MSAVSAPPPPSQHSLDSTSRLSPSPVVSSDPAWASQGSSYGSSSSTFMKRMVTQELRSASEHKYLAELYEDEVDLEEELPDFKFEYDTHLPPTSVKPAALDSPVDNGRDRSRPESRGSRYRSPALSDLKSTPPSSYLDSVRPSRSTSASILGSGSSVGSKILSSVTSTASSSPMLPTPPGPAVSEQNRSRSNPVLDDMSASGSGSGRSARIYSGGARTFQRVVSAPISRFGQSSRQEIDEPTTSPTATITENIANTIRPALLHTSSASSIGEGSQGALSKSAYATPGAPDRVMGGMSSTTRRLGNLSRFGGPARRVIAPPVPEPTEEEETKDIDANSAQREDSPGPSEFGARRSRSAHDRLDELARDRQFSGTPPSLQYQQRPQHRKSPSERPAASTSPEEGEDEAKKAHARYASASLLQEQRRYSPIEREASPRDHFADQENRYQPRVRELSPLQGEFKADSSKGAPYQYSTRSTAPPLRPSQQVPVNASAAPAPLHHPRQTTLLASRPAPVATAAAELVTEPIKQVPIPEPTRRTATEVTPYHQQQQQQQFQNPAQYQTQVPQQANPVPNQVGPAGGKRSFLVNGVPYERVGLLGKGGSSKVYSVLCPNNRVVYALKRVALDRTDAETFQSYTNEIELLKRLRGHDRIIQLIDHQILYGQSNRPKTLMVVMECGEIDFAMLLDEQRGKPVNMNFVGLFWQQMLEAVHAVHLENVVHTDLKPANFVLVKGRLKIIDFGIAKAVANDTVNIQRDQQIGTVNYMSPEAIQRMNNQKVLKLSYPSDVWSLGCILYQMIYGNPPFNSIPGGPLAKMNTIANSSHIISYPEQAIPRSTMGANGVPTDPSSMAVTVPLSAISTMQSCLAYKKEHRLTIPELLAHDFINPAAAPSTRFNVADLPEDMTTITPQQMSKMVNFIRRQLGYEDTHPADDTGEDLFRQLRAQNLGFDQ